MTSIYFSLYDNTTRIKLQVKNIIDTYSDHSKKNSDGFKTHRYLKNLH